MDCKNRKWKLENRKAKARFNAEFTEGSAQRAQRLEKKR
jgi:hypothetical protein